MERLARLFPLRALARVRRPRGLVPCGTLLRPTASFGMQTSHATPMHWVAHTQASTANADARGHVELPSRLPAFARVPLRHGVPQAEPVQRHAFRSNDPVRVYRSPSRVVLVGHIDAVCSMIDQYIAVQGAGVVHGLLD